MTRSSHRLLRPTHSSKPKDIPYDDVKPKAEKKLTFEELAFFKATDFSHSST